MKKKKLTNLYNTELYKKRLNGKNFSIWSNEYTEFPKNEWDVILKYYVSYGCMNVILIIWK